MALFVIAATLPLLYGIKNFESALLFSSSVLLSIFFLELVFLVSCKLRKPTKSALACFVLLSCVLMSVSLAGESLWPETWERSAGLFPLAFASAFGLARITTLGTYALAYRARIWAGFACLVLVFGAWGERSVTAQTFPAGPLWLVAFSLAAFRFFKKPRAA